MESKIPPLPFEMWLRICYYLPPSSWRALSLVSSLTREAARSKHNRGAIAVVQADSAIEVSRAWENLTVIVSGRFSATCPLPPNIYISCTPDGPLWPSMVASMHHFLHCGVMCKNKYMDLCAKTFDTIAGWRHTSNRERYVVFYHNFTNTHRHILHKESRFLEELAKNPETARVVLQRIAKYAQMLSHIVLPAEYRCQNYLKDKLSLTSTFVDAWVNKLDHLTRRHKWYIEDKHADFHRTVVRILGSIFVY